MKTVLVYTKWKRPSKDFDFKRYKKGILLDLEIIGDLEYKDNMYTMKEYTKIKDSYASIGIKTSKDLKSVYAKGKFGYERKLEKLDDKNIWISYPMYFWNDLMNRYDPINTPIGVNQCGVIFFEGIDFDNNVIHTSEVKIRPSLISEQEYDIMKLEVKIISQKLVEGYQVGIDGNTLGNVLMDVEILDMRINNLYDIIFEINNRPEENLVDATKYVKLDKIKKFNSKLLLEYRLYPFKNTFKSNIKEKTYDIKEHRILKGAIYNLLNIFVEECKYEHNIINNIKLQINDLIENECHSEYYNNFKNKKNLLEKKAQILNKRIIKWNNINNKLRELLDLEIFFNISMEPWYETHIFNFNYLYMQAFEEIEIVNKLIGKNKSLDLFQKDLIKSPNLYEKWVFLKILDYFINELRFNYIKDNLIESLIYYYDKHLSLRGYSIELCNANNNKIQITYEKNLEGKRPDISLIFIDKEKKKEIFLDAKYKTYRKKYILDNDIYISAERYISLSNISQCAFLVQPSDSIDNNFNYRMVHRCGYFKLKPSDDKGLRIFAKLAMHFYMGWDNLCPDCGGLAKVISKHKENIYYFECENENCGSFWVKSYCYNIKEHPKDKDNKEMYENKLYKYSNYNFHEEHDRQWDVHCPICGKALIDRYKKSK